MSRNWGISIISSRPSSKAQLVPSGSARPRAEDVVGPLLLRGPAAAGATAPDGGGPYGHGCRHGNPPNGETPPLLFLCEPVPFGSATSSSSGTPAGRPAEPVPDTTPANEQKRQAGSRHAAPVESGDNRQTPCSCAFGHRARGASARRDRGTRAGGAPQGVRKACRMRTSW